MGAGERINKTVVGRRQEPPFVGGAAEYELLIGNREG